MARSKAIFKGQTFVLSGKLSQPRKEYEELIRKHAGEIASSVTAAVTYLISTEDDVKACSQKVAVAQGRGVPIVQEGYIGACIAAGKLLASSFFAVKAAGKKRKAAASKEAPLEAAKVAKAEAKVVTTDDKLAVIPKSGLAGKAEVVTEEVSKGFVKATLIWDVELILNDLAAGKDRFYNMQLLANKEGGEFWAVQHWGKTGLEGSVHVDGPFDTIHEAKKVFRRKYRGKTGTVFGQLGASFVEEPGKYKVLAKEAEPEPGAPPREGPGTWQYYLHNKVDGKKLGWYDYDAEAAGKMEKYWRQYGRDPSLTTRIIQSDYFKYEVNFGDMIQRNTKSGMRRVIRRVAQGERPSNAAPEKIPDPAEPDPGEESDDEEEAEDEVAAEEDEETEEEEEEEAAVPAKEDAPTAEEEEAEEEAPAAKPRKAPEAAAAPAGAKRVAAPAPGGEDAAAAEEEPPAAAKPAGGRAATGAAASAPDPAELDTLAAEDTMVAETLPMRGAKRKAE